MAYGAETWLEWIGATGWAQLVNAGGLFAAAAGIALTLAQLGLFRRQLKLDALIKIMDSNRQIVSLGFEHPDVWSSLEGETSALQVEEAMARRRYLQLWTNHMQIMWAAQQLGLVSEGEWQAYRQDLSEFLRSPSLQEHWRNVARFYPEGFRELVSELSGLRRDDAELGRGESGPREGK